MERVYDEEVTSETQVRNGRSHHLGVLVAGAGVGALLMYLFDPDRGRGRRTRLSDQIASKVQRLGETAGSKARHLRNRAKGLVHELNPIQPDTSRSVST
jgi:hypothetical protein